ncbi:MAG: hypothetical protein H6649_12760 [Caldilineae bacterium]|nr:hypothetical protein [Anaerolineae bacterium]MCB0206640.1 hypothetical protein [Anaerolineae bacterium]MCB9154906.1 hypothetical protein [Caldilineae bacterium]
MNPAEYLEAVKTRLLTEPLIRGFQVRRERSTLADAHLRVRAILFDGSNLEFSEYVQRDLDGVIQVVTYSYNWTDSDGGLIKRWDNTPHFPGLPHFPDHVHDGADDTVLPGVPVDIFVVLDEIINTIGTIDNSSL